MTGSAGYPGPMYPKAIRFRIIRDMWVPALRFAPAGTTGE
jgi:hypothetical protein